MFGEASWPQYRSNIAEITYERTHPLADWRAGLIENVIKAASYIFECFNWPEWDRLGARDLGTTLFARRFQ